MLIQIKQILSEHNISYKFDGILFDCGNICILPIFFTSDIDVESIVNSRHTKWVMEGSIRKDLARLQNFFKQKQKIEKGIEISARKNSPNTIPTFVSDIFTATACFYNDGISPVPHLLKIFKMEEQFINNLVPCIDIEIYHTGVLLHWTRYIVIDTNILFQVVSVSDPHFYVYRTLTREISWIKKNLSNVTKIITLAPSRLSHYYRLGFIETKVDNYKSVGLDMYACSEHIPLYWIEYDYNRN